MAFLIMQSIKSFSNFLLQQQQVSKGVENYHRPMIVNAHDGDGKQSGGRAVRLGGR